MTEPTARQKEVGSLIAQGVATSEIAKRLGISPATVSEHRHELYRVLGIAGVDRPEVVLTHYALAQDWVRNLFPGRGRPRKLR